MRIVLNTDLSPAAHWALSQLERSLGAKDLLDETGPSLHIGLAGQDTEIDRILAEAGVHCPSPPESLVIHRLSDRIILAGRDERGLVYALLETARAIECAENDDPLGAVVSTIESPHLAWRSMQVFLCNQKLEAGWFYSEDFWDGYLSWLAFCRYNNLSLTFAHQIPYLAPPYPFLMDMPEFPQVRPLDSTPEQRRHNLAMLKNIAEMAQTRGLHFTFAVWSQHAFTYGDAQVEGLTEDILPDYNALGLRKILDACPAIDGVQFRMNIESGISEDRQAEFYNHQFLAIADCGRPIRLDLRAKGLSDQTIELARKHIPNTVISTKHWCEHLGMPYPMPAIQQADRNNYRRYGTWDLLEKSRPWPLIHRLWSAGSQRLLLWGDPEWMRRFVRSTCFAGEGFEVMAPLTNKGVLSDAEPWSIFKDASCRTYEHEYQRYWMFDLLFGRWGYAPDASGHVWQRELKSRLGEAAESIGRAYRSGSRILPLLTTVLQWSASLWRFWPEIYPGRSLEQDIDIEPSDPTQFYGISEYVEDTLQNDLNGKWTPSQVAHCLQTLAQNTRTALADAQISASAAQNLRSTTLDFSLLADLADYHACRLRACTHFAFYTKTHDAGRLHEAHRLLSRAKTHWTALADLADGVYHDDLVFGRREADHCGHWKNRLNVIEQDLASIARLQKGETNAAPVGQYPGESERPEQPSVTIEPLSPAIPGRELPLHIRLESSTPVRTLTCHYRIANQTLPFDRVQAQSNGKNRYFATVPGEAITSRWDLMIFFEIRYQNGEAVRWPCWQTQTPYLVIPIDPDKTP